MNSIHLVRCFRFSLVIALGLMGSGSALAMGKPAPRLEDPRTVSYVDLHRYMGLWHQVAFFPNRFQKGCTIDTTATYTLREDGKVTVLNECTRSEDAKRKRAEGTSRVVDPQTQAKLKVKFFWLAPAGDYWILDLGSEYEYAVVGTPDRKYLWILAREPHLELQTYERLVSRVAEQGFDVSKLEVTGQLN